jgi:hypothetical protein
MSTDSMDDASARDGFKNDVKYQTVLNTDKIDPFGAEFHFENGKIVFVTKNGVVHHAKIEKLILR